MNNTELNFEINGRHVTEIENADLNVAQLRQKRVALVEGHDDADLVRAIDAEIARRTRKHSITTPDLLKIAHMTNEQWNNSEFNDAQ
jgi:hypothetical protein